MAKRKLNPKFRRLFIEVAADIYEKIQAIRVRDKRSQKYVAEKALRKGLRGL